MNFEKVAVVGAGAWGTSLSVILSKNIGQVNVWAREPEVVDAVNTTRQNKIFLPNIEIPSNVEFSNDAQKVLDKAQLVVWVVPIHFLDSTLKKFGSYIQDGAIMLNAGKGIETHTWLLPSEVLRKGVPNAGACGTIMGPNIAFEVALDKYAEAVVALDNYTKAELAAAAFCTPKFKVKASNDVVGFEIGAALKNIVALAAGFCDGMKLGANTKAIIMARGFQEIYRAAAALGAWGDSFVKESAILGDVLTTCISPDSRNRTTGEKLGQGMNVEQALKELNGRVCAGLETIQICKMFETRYALKLPIMSSLCALAEGRIDRDTCLKNMIS